MEEDIKKPLLKKGMTFQKLFEECQVKLQRIKQKNDFMQKQVGEEADDEIKQEIKKQKEFLEKEMREIKDAVQDMSTFKDPQYKNKLKSIRADLQKQIDRNRSIINDLVAKSFLRRSEGHNHDNHQDMNDLVEGGKIDYKKLDYHHSQNQNLQRASIITDEVYENTKQFQVDYDIQRKIQKQKNEIINQTEQVTMRVNQIMNQVAVLINQQGEDLDIIDKNVGDTHQNILSANEHLEQANTLQKKSRTKYIVLVIVIIVVVAITLGFVFFFR